MCKISVIVPAFNLEKYLERCLDSLLAQTHKDMEIIVVDDGSTDGTGAIIDAYAWKESRIVAIHKENAGVTAARLDGIRIAKGEWIGFTDGDDFVEPEMFWTLLTNAIRYGADISHCGYQMVFEDGRVHSFHNTGHLVEQDTSTGIKDLLEGIFVEPGLWNKLFHKTLFQRLLLTDLLDLSIKINEDLLMNYYLFREANLSIFSDFCPYHYMVRKTSASRQKLNQHRIYDPIKVKRIILENADGKVFGVARSVYMYTCLNTYHTLLTSCDSSYENDRKDIRNMIAQNRNWLKLLGKKRCMLGQILISFPALYNYIYRFYEGHFQKKVYE